MLCEFSFACPEWIFKINRLFIIEGVDHMSFEPKIVAFCCNWCSYAAADLAGTARMQYPHNVRIIRVMCSGMVHPEFVMDALAQGADGVMVLG
jgi:F420-non-reducing hydrogenase iron-sulfur subunit